jgi:nucleoside transporter
MMFLQYFGLGAWIVPLARYLQAAPADGGAGFTPAEVGLMYASLPVAGMVSPLLVGPLADRFFAAEKLLGVLQLLGAVLLAAAGWWCGHGATPGTLFPILLAYSLVFMPTLPLTNVIALRNLPAPAETFSQVRLVGTFGWIVSGFAVAWVFNPVSPEPLFLAAGTAAVLGVTAFQLPHTPPKGHGRSAAEVIGLPALKMFADRAFVTFAVAAVLVHMTNQFYTLFAARFLAESGVGKPEQALTLAQWCEMACMAAVPWLVRTFGLKLVMLAGLVGWTVRTAVMAWGPVPLTVGVAVPLHGFGYVLFSIVAALFVDREAPPHLRAGAQALVTFLGGGPAALLGYWLAGAVGGHHQTAAGTDWQKVWLVPTIGCGAAAVVFILLFREPKARPPQTEGAE